MYKQNNSVGQGQIAHFNILRITICSTHFLVTFTFKNIVCQCNFAVLCAVFKFIDVKQIQGTNFLIDFSLYRCRKHLHYIEALTNP